MWCRSDVRLWHSFYLWALYVMSLRRLTVAFFSFIGHVCDVAQTSDGGILVTYFGYKPFLWCRSGARLWLVIIYYFPTRRHPDPHLVSLFLSFGFREDYRPTSILYLQCIHILFRSHFCWNTHMHSCWHLLYLKSELSCEYIQSTHLACWFGQMWTKAISWMKSSIASPTSSGVPVSPLRSWSWSLFYNRFRLPPNKFIGSHSDTRWTVI